MNNEKKSTMEEKNRELNPEELKQSVGGTATEDASDIKASRELLRRHAPANRDIMGTVLKAYFSCCIS